MTLSRRVPPIASRFHVAINANHCARREGCPDLARRAPSFLMWLLEMPATTVAHMENDNRFLVDGEQHPVDMRFATVEKLAHLVRKLLILRCERATPGMFR